MLDRGILNPQTHGGGITRVGDTYYWFGEDRSQDDRGNENRPGAKLAPPSSSNEP